MVRRALHRVAAYGAAALALAACSTNSQRADTTTTPMNNFLSEDQRRAGWQLLFDGQTTSGWHTYQKTSVIGWQAENGELFLTTGGDDLISDRQFDSFELSLEWKVPPQGNSGVFYWAHEATKRVYENAPEMQILDNAGHRDGLSPLTSAGALYGLYPAPLDAVKPAGEWNQSRIVTKGGKVEHYLNGVLTGKGDFDSDELKAKIAASKFNQWPTYGKSRRGHIGLQGDHGNIWFRNIYIRTLR